MQENYTLYYKLALRNCDTLLNLLAKAENFVKETGVEEVEILEARLAPDMFNFTRQIQISTDLFVGVVYRLAGLEKPSLPDTEKTFAELVARVNTAKELILKVNPESVEADKIKNIKIYLGWMPAGMYFEGGEFLENFAFTNTFFHVAAAYNILRMKGVTLNKQDFLGKVEMKQG